MTTDRRHFFFSLLGSLIAGGTALTWRILKNPVTIRTTVRPPGALSETAFLNACIKCGQCTAACPRACIRLHPLSDGPHLYGAPFIDTRQRACNLCMECGQVCPTGALQAISKDKETIKGRVSMGLALVDTTLCISFLGRLCGICRDACPFPGDAIKLDSWARPVVLEQGCVGCGLCAEICPQQPTAIRVDPNKGRVRG